MELCSETLEDFIQNSMTKDRKFALFDPTIKLFLRFPSLFTLQILKNLVIGVNFLHSLGIIHNDVKPRNILLSKKNR
jgi:serine/threonine protein kinase